MNISFLIATHCLASGIVSLIDAFTIANLWQRSLTGSSAPLFSTELVSLDGKPVTVQGGVTLIADRSLSDAVDAAYIIIPPFMPLPTWDRTALTVLTDWLTRRHQNGVPIAALCTGSFLLAATGLLDGRLATTNWQFARRFQSDFPQVRLKPDEMMTNDDGLICTGAATSYFNLALLLIEQFGSRELARRCAKALLIDPNRTSQAPYTLTADVTGHNDASILEAQRFMEDHYASLATINDVAAHVGISPRHFKRRFKTATGKTPLTYLQNLKIASAKRKLELTRDSIEDITRQIGYEDASTFRRLFKQRVSLSPREYRDKFSGT